MTSVAEKAPYGLCECSDCLPGLGCGGMGPAVLLVTRGKEQFALCTRCDLSTDKDVALLVTEEDPANFTFDALGAFVVMGELVAKKDGGARKWRDATDEECARYRKQTNSQPEEK